MDYSFHRVPRRAYQERMARKSNSMVLAVSDDDPATTFGAINVMLNLKKYVSRKTQCGSITLRTEVFGDQLFCERFRQGVHSRTDEDPDQRLSCFLPLAQDWHAQKVKSIK